MAKYLYRSQDGEVTGILEGPEGWPPPQIFETGYPVPRIFQLVKEVEDDG